MGMLIDTVGEEPPLVEADIAGGRADQPRDGMAFHIFRHIEADEIDAKNLGEPPGDFGLADTGWSREQIAPDRFFRFAQTRSR